MRSHYLVALFKPACDLFSEEKQKKHVRNYWLMELDIAKQLRYCKPLFILIAQPGLKIFCLCNHTVVVQDPR